MRRQRRVEFLLASCLIMAGARLAAQASPSLPGTIVILQPREATAPVPLLWGNDAVSREVGDQLFLRLAELGPARNTSDEKSFEPRLARRWQRVDSLTLAFDLDPRARWHDGTPVTSADVVATMDRARNRADYPQAATLLRHIVSVTAPSPGRVVFRFDRVYSEQFYDATYHVPPLPAHLVKGISAADLPKSPFAASPVGNGPYRWVRRVGAQQLIELRADSAFFLGRPGIGRVLFQAVGDGQARMNLLLSEEADAVDNIYQFGAPDQVLAQPAYTTYRVPSLNVGFFRFNTRDPSDTSRPHPILSDPEVRRALALALDRSRLAHAGWGPESVAPAGPVPQALWIYNPKAPQPPYDTTGARELFALRGWSDSDGDGILDKQGRPLALTMLVPSTSVPRARMAQLAQEQLRQVGVDLRLLVLDPVEIQARWKTRSFDLDFGASTMDPSPSGLVQSWSCAGIGAGGLNYTGYCDPAVDSLFEQAITTAGKPGPIWTRAITRLQDDAPAIFIFSPTLVPAVHRRFDHVTLRPQSTWLDLWRWHLVPGAALPRDRANGN
jgi:peptide/nickel transport system substrate-binding protein